jgi:hypothetical protein
MSKGLVLDNNLYALRLKPLFLSIVRTLLFFCFLFIRNIQQCVKVHSTNPLTINLS